MTTSTWSAQDDREFDEHLTGASAGDEPSSTPTTDGRGHGPLPGEVKNVRSGCCPNTDSSRRRDRVRDCRRTAPTPVSAAANRAEQVRVRCATTSRPSSRSSSANAGRWSPARYGRAWRTWPASSAPAHPDRGLAADHRPRPEASPRSCAGAAEAAKVDLALRAVAAAGDQATDEDLEEEVAGMIGGTDLSIGRDRPAPDAGQLSALRSEIAKRKTAQWLVERRVRRQTALGAHSTCSGHRRATTI